MKDSRRAYLASLDELWPEMAAAFRKAIRDVTNNVDFDALEAAIKAKNIDAAMKAVQLDAAALGALSQSVATSHTAGGQRSVDAVVQATRKKPAGGRVVATFEAGNARAAGYAKTAGSRLVTAITEPMRDILKEAIADGLSQGHGNDKIARVIAGEWNGKRRVGGLVGLTEPDAGYMRQMRAALEHPGGPDAYRSASGAKKFWIGQDGTLKSAYDRRNKRFDGMVRRAIEAGKPLSAKDKASVLEGFRSKMLKDRGENIARTETAAAQTAGQREGYQQLIDAGKIGADSLTLVWDSAGDARTRDDHAAMDGQERKLGVAFTAPDGSRLLGPGDASLGASADQVINCRCWTRPRLD